jgi:hypothetical protein
VRLAAIGCVAFCAAVAGLAVGSGDDRAQGPVAGPAARIAPRGFGVHHPRRYRVPRGAVRVASAHGLRMALAVRRPTAIVLAPGSYGGTQPFADEYGHRIYAARRGTAVLHAGLSLGGNRGAGGALVRGLVLDVRDADRTVEDAAIAVWGSGRNTTILDTKVLGHGDLPSGVVARRPDGLVIRRLVARGFTSYGVLVDANDLNRGRLRDRAVLEDLDIARVSRPVPRSSHGRAEACIWIGNTALIRRARVRSCAWAGLWTGTATTAAKVDQLDADGTPTGVYIEHFTHGSTFRRLIIGRHVESGVNAEWDDPAWGGRPASVDNVIENSRFASSVVGVYLDQGTTRTTVRRSTFAGQSWGAIGDYRGNGNAAYGNRYRDVAGVRHDHLSTLGRP